MIYFEKSATVWLVCAVCVWMTLASPFAAAAPHPVKFAAPQTDALMVDVKLRSPNSGRLNFAGRVVLPMGKNEWSVVEESKGQRLLIRAKLIEPNVAEVEARVETTSGNPAAKPADSYTILVEVGQEASMQTESFGGAENSLLKVRAVRIRYSL